MTRNAGANSQSLRQQAESLLARSKEPDGAASNEERSRAGHELRVHQVELELQNEELRQAQVEAHESKRQYQLLCNHSPAALLTVEANGRIAQANLAVRRFWGLSPEKLSGRLLADLILPADQVAVQFMLENALTSKTPQRREISIANIDGSIRFCLLTCHGAFDDDKDFVLATLTDVTDLKQAEEALRTALREKEILLNEFQHRVKNHMQTVHSLLTLQVRKENDPRVKDVLTKASNRVVALSVIHEAIYESEDLSEVNLKNYLNRLSGLLVDSFADERRPPKVRASAPDDLTLPLDKAAPLGLVVNELVTNALKYAFPQGDGEIALSCTSQGGRIELVVGDDGVGLPEGVDFSEMNTMGLKLVKGLVETQLDGVLEINSRNGAEFIIRIPG
jgi:two-component system sensor kinase